MCVRYFFFSSRRRHTRSLCDWSSDVCSSDLLRLFARGLCAPLPLFPESSWEFAQRKDGAKSARTDPLQAARKVWHGGGDYRRGECDDRWFQLAFRCNDDPLDAEFEEIALAVARPILEALEETP